MSENARLVDEVRQLRREVDMRGRDADDDVSAQVVRRERAEKEAQISTLQKDLEVAREKVGLRAEKYSLHHKH